jgi:hypothetical protein
MAMASPRLATPLTGMITLACWVGLVIAYLVGTGPGTVVDSGVPAMLLRIGRLVAWLAGVVSWVDGQDVLPRSSTGSIRSSGLPGVAVTSRGAGI